MTLASRSPGVLAPLLFFLAAAALFTGCAHNYGAVPLDLKPTGSQRVAVAVLDQRPYIHPGPSGKAPTFVGVQRSLAGVPFDVHTESKRPLAEDWAFSIARALESRGFKAEPVVVTNALSRTDVMRRLSETGAPRAILIGIKEWRVDARRKGSLKGDVHLEVMDSSGGVIAESRALGRNDLGFALEGSTHARDATMAAYKATLEQLLNDPRVVEGLR